METVALQRMTRVAVEMATKGVAGTDDLATEEDAAFWLGSVSAAMPEQVKEFIGLARERKIAEMAEHAAVDSHIVYGLLVRRTGENAGYRLFVVTQGEDLWRDQECLFTEVVTGIDVVGIEDTESPRSTLTLWDELWYLLGIISMFVMMFLPLFAWLIYGFPRLMAWLRPHLPGQMQSHSWEVAIGVASGLGITSVCLALWSLVFWPRSKKSAASGAFPLVHAGGTERGSKRGRG